MGIFVYMCVLSCPMIHLELCGCNTIGFTFFFKYVNYGFKRGVYWVSPTLCTTRRSCQTPLVGVVKIDP